MEATSAAVAAALRASATQKVKEVELDFVAELLLGTREDNESLDATALAPLLVEALEDLAWVESSELTAMSASIARIITGEVDAREEEESEQALQERVREALKCEYAIDKSCLAVLLEDQDWHPARIRKHLDGPIDLNKPTLVSLQLEVEFIEFGKLQVVQLEDVVLDDDVADDDDDDDLRPCRCEMCEREMRLTFHHLTPRVTHAKYLKMGYSREFLNSGVMICRPCHSKIHSSEDNKTLAREYNTLDKIMSHPEILRYVNYARKQRSSFKPEKRSKWPVGK